MTKPPCREQFLAEFEGLGYDKGRGTAVQALWFAVMNLIFVKWWCPRVLRVRILRLFGASIGTGVLIRHRVRVLWPWKFTVGDDCWIGEDVWVLNLEPVTLGNNVCLSQGAFLCTGSHDVNSRAFEYDNAPITVGDGVWVAAFAKLLRGVDIDSGSVVPAGAIVRRPTASC